MTNQLEALINRAKHIIENGGLLARDTSLLLIAELEQSQQQNAASLPDNRNMLSPALDGLSRKQLIATVQTTVEEYSILHKKWLDDCQRVTEFEASRSQSIPALYLCRVFRDGQELYSPCGKDYPRGRAYYTATRKLPVKLPESFYPDGDIDCPKVMNVYEVINAILASGNDVEDCEDYSPCPRCGTRSTRYNGEHYCHSTIQEAD